MVYEVIENKQSKLYLEYVTKSLPLMGSLSWGET